MGHGDDSSGDAAHDELGNSGSAVGADNDEIRPPIFGCPNNLVMGGALQQETLDVHLASLNFLYQRSNRGLSSLSSGSFDLLIQRRTGVIIRYHVRRDGFQHMKQEEFGFVLFRELDSISQGAAGGAREISGKDNSTHAFHDLVTPLLLYEAARVGERSLCD